MFEVVDVQSYLVPHMQASFAAAPIIVQTDLLATFSPKLENSSIKRLIDSAHDRRIKRIREIWYELTRGSGTGNIYGLT